MEFNYRPPITLALSHASHTLDDLDSNDKHWFIGGNRALAVAIKLLENGKIIALPTDTIYGLAGLAQNTESINALYKLKGRDKNKPLAICVSSTKVISRWGQIDHIPFDLINFLLPGPVTIVVKRTSKLNPSLNPGIESVGIRVTKTSFVRSLTKFIDQPLALTSANKSNEPSSLTPDEFSHLWPELGGIFYTIKDKSMNNELYRVGSTIVDLTVPNKFKIIRRGISVDRTLNLLHQYGFTESDS